MKTAILSLALLAIALTASAQELLQTYKWSDLAKSGELHATTPVTVDGRDVLKIENTNNSRLQITLLEIKSPAITATLYELTGEIRYDSIEGDGYLEMLNYFPPVKPGQKPAEYFSRTLGDFGPMGKISGKSDWREFVLPFDRTGTSNAPTSLRFNLVLPGRGTVYLGPVKLLQLPGGKSAYNAIYPGSWWTPNFANKFFGWGGAVIGCFGGLCGWLGSRGRARGVVLGILIAFVAIGAISAIAGIIAAVLGQPRFVLMPLALTACILLIGGLVNLRQIQRNYSALELRRMAAIDASM